MVGDHSEVAAVAKLPWFCISQHGQANGIVVQEAMTNGMPSSHSMGRTRTTRNRKHGNPNRAALQEYIIDRSAATMDLLAENGDLAERMSVAGRRRAVESGYYGRR